MDGVYWDVVTVDGNRMKLRSTVGLSLHEYFFAVGGELHLFKFFFIVVLNYDKIGAIQTNALIAAFV